MPRKAAALAAIVLTSWFFARGALKMLWLDRDSLYAMTAFFMARAPLHTELRWLAVSRISASPETLICFVYWLLYGPLGAHGPEAFRWLAIMLHAANGLLVTLVAARWARPRWALAAGLAYVVFSSGLTPTWTCIDLAHEATALFMIAGLLWHLRRREDRSPWLHVGGLLVFSLLAALSKETGFVFLPIIAAFEILSPAPRWRALTAAAALLLLAWMRLSLFSLLAWPQPNRAAWWCLDCAAIGAAFSTRHKTAAFCWIWCALTLLPVSGLLPIALPPHIHGLQSRYLIPVAAGLTWLAAIGLERCERRASAKAAFIAAAACLAWLAYEAQSVQPTVQDQLEETRRDLETCGDPLGERCLSGALSLPLVRAMRPDAYDQLVDLLETRLASRSSALAFVDFFGQKPFEAGAPRWRCAEAAVSRKGSITNCEQAVRNYALGRAAMNQSRFADAVSLFGEAAENWPGFVEASLAQAEALHKLGKDRPAELAARQAGLCPMAYFLFPDSPWLDPRAEWLLARRNATNALAAEQLVSSRGLTSEELARLARKHPELPALWFEAGYRLQAAGDLAQAYRIFSRLTQLHPEQAAGWSDRGVAAGLYGRRPEAIADFKRALALDPRSGDAARSLRALGVETPR